jgi:hypothetical protein
VGRSLLLARSLSCCAPFVARVARTGGGGAARRVSVRGGLGTRIGTETGIGTATRAADPAALASEQSASCGEHAPDRKLRMKLLWQAKMVTRARCLLPGLLGRGTGSRAPRAGFGLARSASSNPIPAREQGSPTRFLPLFLNDACFLSPCQGVRDRCVAGQENFEGKRAASPWALLPLYPKFKVGGGGGEGTGDRKSRGSPPELERRLHDDVLLFLHLPDSFTEIKTFHPR